MIRISKPAAPAVLQDAGRAKRTEHCTDYDRSPRDYDAGKKTSSFAAAVYAHPAVKQALILAQHGKCCFCERKIGAEGDVEHFRPKAGFRQGPRTRLGRPGYYWLAYDWDNLLFACPICNQRFKGNFFPLLRPVNRATNHHGDMAREEPLFINPAETDPADFIGFREEVAYAISGDQRAKETIKALGLNRDNLAEDRRGHLKVLSAYRQILALQAELAVQPEGRLLIVEAEAFLADATLDTAKFAAMSRAAAALDFRDALP